MREGITFIWFTGIISQYNVSSYNINELRINHNLLDKILKEYRSDKYIAIINVRNDLEKQQYFELIKKEELDKKLIFIFCDPNTYYVDAISTLKYTYDIRFYIDCSRKRLVSLVGLIEPHKLIHISQLLS